MYTYAYIQMLYMHGCVEFVEARSQEICISLTLLYRARGFAPGCDDRFTRMICQLSPVRARHGQS